MCVILSVGALRVARPGMTRHGTARHSTAQSGTARHAAVMLRSTLVLLCVTLACADQDKRAEMSPVPFMMGSRYGRSPDRDRLTPRNDRFIMGSRYGKRSDTAGVAMPACPSGTGAGQGPCRRLVCERAPLLAVYRCLRAHYRPPRDRRAADAGRDDE